jgi:hypothetical protein
MAGVLVLLVRAAAVAERAEPFLLNFSGRREQDAPQTFPCQSARAGCMPMSHSIDTSLDLQSA